MVGLTIIFFGRFGVKWPYPVLIHHFFYLYGNLFVSDISSSVGLPVPLPPRPGYPLRDTGYIECSIPSGTLWKIPLSILKWKHIFLIPFFFTWVELPFQFPFPNYVPLKNLWLYLCRRCRAPFSPPPGQSRDYSKKLISRFLCI